MTLQNTVKNGVARVQEGLQIFRKNVFDLQGVPAFLEFYNLYVWPWKYVYKGFYDAWHIVPVRAIDTSACQKDKDGRPFRNLATMNAGKMACAQLARYVWGEGCDITVSMKGRTGEGPDPLNEYIHEVLRANSFDRGFGEIIEKAFALGGAAIKEWADVPKDETGKDAGPARIRLSFHMADQFIPTAWNNHQVSEGLFVSREAKDGFYYSTVEWHKWRGKTYVVTNDLYRMKTDAVTEPQNILGWWYPLNAVYPTLSPSTEFKELEKTMFQYIRPFGANFADDNSPLGMSVYATAMDTLHALDIAFDSFQREFVLGKKRIIVPSKCIRTVQTGKGKAVRYFDATSEVYEALATDDPDSLKVHDNTVELRVDEHIAAINALLSILCAQVGFDPGTLAFDMNYGLKTATEVISQNSKTYNAVQNQQNNFRQALEDMVDAIIELSVRYDIEWNGQSIASLVAGGYDKSVYFDDGIIQDRQTDINEGILLVSNSLMSKKRFMMDKLGYTEEEALQELQEIANESHVSVSMYDLGEQQNTETLIDTEDSANIVEEAEDKAGKTLNGAQTQSLISVIAQYQNGDITLGQAVNIISIAIGISKAEAQALIEGAI